jgi:hypothetical protein
MPPPVPATRLVRALLEARGLTVADMAAAIGRDVLTLRNVITGAKIHPPTRQAISDFLGVEMFPGVTPNLECVELRLPAGTEITLPTPATAKILESLWPKAAKRERNRIALFEAVVIRILLPPVTASLETLPTP